MSKIDEFFDELSAIRMRANEEELTADEALDIVERIASELL